MAAYINCRIWWCKDGERFNYKWKLGHVSLPLHSLTSKQALFPGHNVAIAHDVMKSPLKNLCSDVLSQTWDFSPAYIQWMCAKTSSHFIFSWLHIPLWIPLRLHRVSSVMIWRWLVKSFGWGIIIGIGYSLLWAPVSSLSCFVPVGVSVLPGWKPPC